MPVTKTIVYDDWSKGEFGTMNPAKAPNGSWTGFNAVVYRDGRIGPRPGLRDITPTGVANGKLLGLGFSPVTTPSGKTPIFFIQDVNVWLFDPTDAGSLTAASADLAAAPADTDASHVLSKESCRLIGDEVYFTVNDDKAYRLNCRDQTLTAITDSDPNGQGTDIELHRDRLFVCNGGVRVFYTDAASFDSWPDADFFDVGAAYRIISIMSFRDTLVFFTQSGVWAMTGSSPADGTFRRISESLSPTDHGVVATNEALIYIPDSRGAPVIFNGSFGDEDSLKHLEFGLQTDAFYGVQSYGNRDVLFAANNNDGAGTVLWRKNDAWSYHYSLLEFGPWVTRYFDDNVILAYAGTASAPPKFYSLAMNLDRPAFTSDTWAQPGDDSDTPLTAQFELPVYNAPQGKEVRVRSVTVDFVPYNTGSATNNNISLNVVPLARELIPGNGGVLPNPVVLFDEPGTGAIAQINRAVGRGFAGGFGGGFRVAFTMKGVAIDRVVVEIEEQDAPVV